MNTPVKLTQEIRIGLVMYGGVSLAIYMNGVVQELLKLVRATAPGANNNARLEADADGRLPGTLQIYRELGQMLSYGEATRTRADRHAEIRTRFVIDILSGTSAGGINAIFLAKALVNDQDLEELKNLWVTEGDIDRLLNDVGSVRDLAPLRPNDPPHSLLNGQRMYKKLLDAFRGMDDHRPRGTALVDDLDLFVTTTDVRGAPIQLRLADKVVEEKRHKSVFHFRYRPDRTRQDLDGTHFSARFNPILAFAARCTSAFPFAFEPMRFADARLVAHTFRRKAEQLERAPDDLRLVMEADVQGAQVDPQTGEPIDYPNRAFTDGGYLDNKPFQYAIGALDGRPASLPVDRKLIYVEPSPEIMGLNDGSPPDALENVRAALLGVPRYETIREDLQSVLRRNQLATRIGHILDGLEGDLATTNAQPAYHSGDFRKQGLENMIEQYGVAYGGYHRLKIAALTDELAEIVGNALQIDLRSDQFRAVRTFVKAWRDGRYVVYAQDSRAQTDTYNAYLLDFDVAFRQRRLDFLRNRLDLLGQGGAKARDLLLRTAGHRFELNAGFEEQLRAATARLRAELEPIRRKFIDLKRAMENLDDDDLRDLSLLGQKIEQPGRPRAEWKSPLDNVLELPTEEDRVRYATEVLQSRGAAGGLTHRAVIDRIAGKLADRVKDVCIEAADLSSRLWQGARSDHPEGAARAMLQWYYERFETYDHAAFPILYATSVGQEHDTVDVIRISPADATSLSQDRNRLAGLSVHHFGAFLDARWRRHDILWGRLDGAERIIASTLPGDANKEMREQMITEAHKSILREELTGPDRDAVLALITGLIADGSWKNERAVWDRLGDRTGRDANAVSQLLRAVAADDSLYNYFKEYKLERTLDSGAITRVAARATTIIGRMLQAIADRRGHSGARLAWVTRLGQFLWGAVEVAIPQSIARVVFKHLVGIFMLVSMLLILIGGVLGVSGIRNQGISWFVAGALLLGVRAFAERLLQNVGWFRWLGVGLAVSAAGGVLYLAMEAFLTRWNDPAGFFRFQQPGAAPGMQLAILIAAVFVLGAILLSETSPVGVFLQRTRQFGRPKQKPAQQVAQPTEPPGRILDPENRVGT
jgi:patatin-related protein